MSDEIIRQFSRDKEGSPITKMELDVLNVAREKGAKVYIDDVLQINSPLNDGRRAHIDLQGDVLNKNIDLIPPPFIDNFNTFQESEWTLTNLRMVVEFDGHFKSYPEPPNYYGGWAYLDRIPVMYPGSFYMKTIGSFQQVIPAGTADVNIYLRFISNIDIVLFLRLIDLNGSGQISFGNWSNQETSLITANVGDIFDLKIVHNNAGNTEYIVKRNDIEIFREIRNTAILTGSVSRRLYTGHASNSLATWIDKYEEALIL